MKIHRIIMSDQIEESFPQSEFTIEQAKLAAKVLHPNLLIVDSYPVEVITNGEGWTNRRFDRFYKTCKEFQESGNRHRLETGEECWERVQEEFAEQRANGHFPNHINTARQLKR